MSKKAPFVAGNWKMHATLAEARALVSAVVRAAPGLGDAGRLRAQVGALGCRAHGQRALGMEGVGHQAAGAGHETRTFGFR